MNNQWTRGQYHLFRSIFGLYLLVHFIQLFPWAAEVFSSQGVLPDAQLSPILFLFPNILGIVDAPWMVQSLIGAAIFLSGAFLLGYRDRFAAVGIWYILACLYGRNPLTGNPSLPYVGWILLAHTCMISTSKPFWSFKRSWIKNVLSYLGQQKRKRENLENWGFPRSIFLAAWIVMALGYGYSGYTKLISPSWTDGTAFLYLLQNPLARPTAIREFLLGFPVIFFQILTWGALAAELLFAPLALIRSLRPFLWLGMLLMHCGLIVLIDFADLSLGMVMLHLFTFDPAWIKPLKAKRKESIFYDGYCGICHGMVRFLLSEDRSATFRFAPLQGDTFMNMAAPQLREQLPDSLIVLTEDQQILTQSTAFVHILKRLGGVWRILGTILAWVPLRTRDGVYQGIAKVRKKLAAPPEEVCPPLPKELRARFLP